MRISDWSSDVCSSDLLGAAALDLEAAARGNLQGDAVGRGAEGADLRQAGGVDGREVALRRPVEQPPGAPRSLSPGPLCQQLADRRFPVEPQSATAALSAAAQRQLRDRYHREGGYETACCRTKADY